jgi:uncharacterized protein
MKFDWDEEKATRNCAKHGVSFDESLTIFNDPLYIDSSDPEHSEEEHRYIRVGCSEQGRILVVSYTERGSVTSNQRAARNQQGATSL